jgi:hypothetical protein
MRRLLAIALMSAAAAGCLPRGDPPAGRQISSDRRSTLSGVIPPTGDGVLRVLVTRPGTSADAADLFLLSVDPAGGPAQETPLLSDIFASSLGCRENVAPCSAINGTAVWVDSDSGAAEGIDVVSGKRLVSEGSGASSDDGQRSFTYGSVAGSVTLFDAQGGSTALTDAYLAKFYGNDFCYASAEGDLIRIPPSGVAEQVATGLISPVGAFVPGQTGFLSFIGWPTPDGTLFVLNRPSADPTMVQTSVRDPLTGIESALPFFDPYPNVSPDGRWILDTWYDSIGKFQFFDYRAGATQVVPVADNVMPGGQWRPGTSEVWTTTNDQYGNSTLWVVTPGSPAVSAPNRSLVPESSPNTEEYTTFTPDGAYYFFVTFNVDGHPSGIKVADARDPTAAGVTLDTSAMTIGPLWTLPDDRLLASVYTRSDDYQLRGDAVLFDPRTGDSRVLGESGRIAAVGQTRVMGMFHFRENRGDLTVADVDSGSQTVLAPEFAVTAFAQQQGTDPLAPGAPIVYQFQARTESPYDGIWLTSCP